MNRLIKIILWVVIVIALLVAVLFGLQKYWATPLDFIQQTKSEAINVVLGASVSNDFGTIYQGEGHFVQRYELFNDSDEPQKIVDARTSCECTRVKINDQFYGMHSIDHPEIEIAPHESKIIEMYFDPDAHGPFSRGAIKRKITLKSKSGEETLINFEAIVSKTFSQRDVQASNVESLPSDEGIVEVTPRSHDFGDIVQSQGPVSTIFIVKNTGDEPLIINRLSTSCGCTTAEMDQAPLQAGEEREMIVTFDPLVHPDQFGEIERVVYLQTSDPERPEVEIDLTGNVIK